MNVVAIKLKTGEELIADHIDSDKKTEKFENVLLIYTQPSQDGRNMMGFLPFMPYVKAKIHEFKKEDIILISSVDEEMEKQYKSVFGVGIAVPDKKLILE